MMFTEKTQIDFYFILQDQHVASATSFTGRFNIYDLILDKCYFEKTTDPSDGSPLPLQMTKEDMTLIKVCQHYSNDDSTIS